MIEVYGLTHRGAVRKENQDQFRFAAPEGRELLTAVLCDGMGGARAGGLAGELAADAFMAHAANSLDETSTPADIRGILTEAVDFANRRVYDKAFEDLTCMGMGCTLVALLVSGKRAFAANVGDSRAYLLAHGRLKQITNDHSLVEDMIARGKLTREEARTHPQRNIITRAVGVEATVTADIFELKFPPDTRFLLCSDGLSGVVPDSELLALMQANPEPKAACEALLQAALERGAPDNVTVLVAQH